MRVLLIPLVLAVLVSPASAEIESGYLREVVVAKNYIPEYNTTHIRTAIDSVLNADPLDRNVRLPEQHKEAVAKAIFKTSILTGVDWHIILAISYIESNMCRHLVGDKKEGASSNSLFSYWSVGCMQVNMRWWGRIIDEAGFQQDDLLDIENGMIIGALVLKSKIDRYGLYEGIRRYNGTGKASYEYLSKVKEVLKALQ